MAERLVDFTLEPISWLVNSYTAQELLNGLTKLRAEMQGSPHSTSDGEVEDMLARAYRIRVAYDRITEVVGLSPLDKGFDQSFDKIIAESYEIRED